MAQDKPDPIIIPQAEFVEPADARPATTLSPEKLRAGILALARIVHMLESNPGIDKLH